ncbi:MAG: pilus assembly protein CpaE [Alphaproteobacteria bacterium]|nr:pilus assembly protein CpaE [Alphaproteobacteria bacterium]MBU0794872.1 pilus assembly protein CpaE [Alphaproteobacteria bacterium]MBU0875501.1 pilus assembly protein CpaE [Alphaproteobacteria bacterium]MBU1771372.1 pilus assembly protein CpaE [Alphaproteobacteria bacterium]
MNAPWKAGGPHGRDAFHAYVCDDHSLEVLRAAAQDMGWPAEKLYKGGLRNAVQSLSMSASPNVLFVDLSESADPLTDINSLAEVCEPGTVVIAAGQVNDVRLYRDLVASGLQDYLLKPLSLETLRDTLNSAQAVFLAPKADAGSDQPHMMVSVIGTRGGVGASTIATSLAYLSSSRGKRSTALLDLDVHFGTGALALDLEPGRGLTDAVENPSRIDGLFIERAMVRASDTLAILSAEAPISQPLLTDGSAYFQLEEELRSAFEWTFVDLPRNMLVQHPHLVHESNAVVVVTEFTLASARDTIRILSWLKTNAPQSQVIVAVNKAQPGVSEITRKDFEQSIERAIDVVLPYDCKVTTQAAKLGKTAAESGRTSKLGQALHELSNQLNLAEAGEIAGKGKSSGSLIGRLLDVKLPGKAKKKAGANTVLTDV